MADIHRLRNPFEHWFSGLVVELLVFSGFIVAVAVLLVVTIFVSEAL